MDSSFSMDKARIHYQTRENFRWRRYEKNNFPTLGNPLNNYERQITLIRTCEYKQKTRITHKYKFSSEKQKALRRELCRMSLDSTAAPSVVGLR